MRNRIHYNRKNPSTRIIRGSVTNGGRQINMGEDKSTKQARKTKKGAADLLHQDDETIASKGVGIFNPQQRESLIDRAGKAYHTPVPVDPFLRGKDESVDEFTTRIQKHIASM